MAVIKGDDMYLQWLMVAAFRYAVNRHATQAMYGVKDVILDNIGLLNDGFIAQFIRDIQTELRGAEYAQQTKEEYKRDFFKRLNGHVGDYVRYLKDERDPKVQELYNTLLKVQELTKEVKIKAVDDYTPPWLYDVEYLKPMLESLQQEYEKRGYARISD